MNDRVKAIVARRDFQVLAVLGQTDFAKDVIVIQKTRGNPIARQPAIETVGPRSARGRIHGIEVPATKTKLTISGSRTSVADQVAGQHQVIAPVVVQVGHGSLAILSGIHPDQTDSAEGHLAQIATTNSRRTDGATINDRRNDLALGHGAYATEARAIGSALATLQDRQVPGIHLVGTEDSAINARDQDVAGVQVRLADRRLDGLAEVHIGRGAQVLVRKTLVQVIGGGLEVFEGHQRIRGVGIRGPTVSRVFDDLDRLSVAGVPGILTILHLVRIAADHRGSAQSAATTTTAVPAIGVALAAVNAGRIPKVRTVAATKTNPNVDHHLVLKMIRLR